MKNAIFKSVNLNFYEANNADLDYIIKLENKPGNKEFIWQGTEADHMDEIEDKDHYLLVIRDINFVNKGYALIHIDRHSLRFELRRFVIDDKGKGYGKEALLSIIRFAFEDLNMNKFWLDVYPDNEVGLNLYHSVGLFMEGRLRENYKADRGYLDQIVFSMLQSEYYEIKESF